MSIEKASDVPDVDDFKHCSVRVDPDTHFGKVLMHVVHSMEKDWRQSGILTSGRNVSTSARNGCFNNWHGKRTDEEICIYIMPARWGQLYPDENGRCSWCEVCYISTMTAAL